MPCYKNSIPHPTAYRVPRPGWGRGIPRPSPITSSRILPALLSGLLLLSGCSARKPIAATALPYRLKLLNARSFLYPPAIPEGHANDAPITVTLDAAKPPAGTDCSAQQGPFHVQQRQNSAAIQISLPPPSTWLSDLEGKTDEQGVDEVAALYSIFADLDRLQQQGCFAGTTLSLREFILQSLPVKPNESLFSGYGYRPDHSGLNLKPGMRLKIERAYFRPGEPGEDPHATKNFLGLSNFYVGVVSTADRKIRFREIGQIHYSPASLAASVQDGNRDSALIRLPDQQDYRIGFYTFIVPKELAISAVMMGAAHASELDSLDHQLRAHLGGGCKSVVVSSDIACFDFVGFVTVTSQIAIELNGKKRFVDWGSRLKDFVPDGSLKSLRIQRLYLNSYHDLRFNPQDPNILTLALIGGDRLQWSKPAHLSNSPSPQ